MDAFRCESAIGRRRRVRPVDDMLVYVWVCHCHCYGRHTESVFVDGFGNRVTRLCSKCSQFRWELNYFQFRKSKEINSSRRITSIYIDSPLAACFTSIRCKCRMKFGIPHLNRTLKSNKLRQIRFHNNSIAIIAQKCHPFEATVKESEYTANFRRELNTKTP